jgi:hypothetical protein
MADSQFAATAQFSLLVTRHFSLCWRVLTELKREAYEANVARPERGLINLTSGNTSAVGHLLRTRRKAPQPLQ